MQDIKLPDLGEGIEAGDVVAVTVAVGDVIAAEQTIVEVETDKAVLEVPCSTAGKVVKVHVAQGDRVAIGATLVTIDADGGAKEPAPAAEEDAAPAEPVSAEAEPASTPEPAGAKSPAKAMPAAAPAATPPAKTDGPVPAGPAARRLARELGVDVAVVAAAHPGERVTEELVKAFVKSGQTSQAAASAGGTIAAPPLPDFAQWGPIEPVPFSSLQRKTAEHLSTGWRLAPHVTQFDQADITALEALRKRFRESEHGQSIKLTVTAFVLKALVAALQRFPQFNASLDTQNDRLVLKRYYHLGVAVDTDAGLIVPVIRDIDRKGVLTIAREMDQLAERTRQRKIGLDELRGGTFTVTNLGGIGGTAFTPIINYPEVAILGLARGRHEPIVVDGQLGTRFMLPLCLSYDHRVVNGADGARFVRYLAGLLEDPEILLMQG